MIDQRKPDEARRTVFKAAKIVFGYAAIDCVVLNLSLSGARVSTPAVTPIPPRVILVFAGGARCPAVRRWARGTQIGFQFEAAPSLGEESADLAQAACEILQTEGLDAAIRQLRAVRYFDDPELSEIAEAAKTAHDRLATALRARAPD